MPSVVTAVAAAPSEVAQAHFAHTLQFETDCSDVHHAMNESAGKGAPDFVLLDVRSEEHFAQGHVPGATHLLKGKIVESKLAQYPKDTLFVTYCAGPHCNGAQRAAIKLAELGRPVKIMIGGITGWVDEGYALATRG